jgi:lipopolysaccharide/colanic/teichoic acid biosynthesis glycosyltransferase
MLQPPRYQNSGGSKLLFFSEVILIVGSFYAAARIDLDVDPLLYFIYEGGLERVIFATVTILLAMYFHHLYVDVRVRSRALLLQELCEVFGLALIAQSLVVYVKPDWILPRWLMIYGVLFCLLSIFVWRILYSQYVLNIVRRHRIVFVGHNLTIREIASEILNRPGWGYEILGYVTDAVDNETGSEKLGKYLGPYDNLAGLARKLHPDRIVVGLESSPGKIPLTHLLQLHYEGLTIEEASNTYELVNQRVCSRELDARELIFSRDLTPDANVLFMQRAIDRAIAFLLLVLCSPLMAITALGLLLSSRQPLVPVELKLGYNGRLFKLLRFRATPGLGWLYRRFHLDALPQLFNVVRGEMALVGPRPCSAEVFEVWRNGNPLFDYRVNVPPGITGWAQINLTEREQNQNPLHALEFDLYYIKHMSQTLNAYILITTFKNRLIWGDPRT